MDELSTESLTRFRIREPNTQPRMEYFELPGYIVQINCLGLGSGPSVIRCSSHPTVDEQPVPDVLRRLALQHTQPDRRQGVFRNLGDSPDEHRT